MGGWNRISGAGGLLKPLAGVPFASMPGAGVAYFLVGSALGVFAMLHLGSPVECDRQVIESVSRSLSSELELEADTEDEDVASEVTGAEEGKVERLRRRLVRERRLKEAALEELEKERARRPLRLTRPWLRSRACGTRRRWWSVRRSSSGDGPAEADVRPAGHRVSYVDDQ
ncbi:hypothetical protein ZWY2020_056198 [Hordeum vulgare]|nr:hypothetical protein ZWY2020_056198 [Hordeum vulgare]